MTIPLLPDDAELIERHLAWLARGDRRRRPAAPATIRVRKQLLQHASRCLPWGLTEADEDDIHTFLAQYVGWTLSTNDTSLRVFYGWGVAVGALTGDPTAELGRPGPGPRVPHPCTDEELAIALRAPRPWRRIVLLAAYAGLRCAEICGATIDHIIDGEWLQVLGKGGKTRVVPLAQPIRDDLEEHGPTVGHLVVGVRGQAMGQPREPRVLTALQGPIWRRLGLGSHITLHAFRHWYASSMLRQGADIRTVQELMGHASLATTQGYTQVTDARRLAAVAALPVLGVEPGSDRLGPQAG